jgi:hypothetical protein
LPTKAKASPTSTTLEASRPFSAATGRYRYLVSQDGQARGVADLDVTRSQTDETRTLAVEYDMPLKLTEWMQRSTVGLAISRSRWVSGNDYDVDCRWDHPLVVLPGQTPDGALWTNDASCAFDGPPEKGRYHRVEQASIRGHETVAVSGRSIAGIVIHVEGTLTSADAVTRYTLDQTLAADGTVLKSTERSYITVAGSQASLPSRLRTMTLDALP